MEEIHTPEAPVFEAPFSQATRHGNTIYVSGQVPVDPSSGEIVEGGIEEQTAQVMENAQSILEAGGSSLDNILKAQVYLTDIEKFEAFNSVYREYISEPKPARSAFEVSELAIDALIEIDFIAES